MTAGLWFYLLFYGSLAAGLPLRRWSAAAPRILRANILFIEAPVFVYGMWILDLRRVLAYAPIPAASVGLVLAALALARLLAPRFYSRPADQGSYVLAAGFSNIGNTGGMFLCYLLFGTPGLALASLYLLPYPFLIFTLGFSLARAYASGVRAKPADYVYNILSNLTALVPLTAMTAGLALNLAGVPMPRALPGVMDVVIKLNLAVACLAIGMTLRPLRVFSPWRPAAALSVLKFAVLPLLALGLAAAAYGWPLPLPGRVLLVQAAMPAALYAVITANLFGLDRDTVNSLWLSTTLLLAPVAGVLFWLFGR